eukprot:PhM_4_TR15644/c1_g1_i5/m.6793
MSVGRQTFTDSPEDEVLVYTDAHTTGYGFVGGHPLVVVSRRWENTFLSKDMFYLEAIALKQAVCCLVREHRRIHVISDNKALVCAVRKRSTTCPRTAQVLADVFATLSFKKAQIFTFL